MQTIPARDINLRYLIDNFDIQLVREPNFFCEWQRDLSELTDCDQQLLDKIKEGYFNLLNYPPLLEGVIRQAVTDPLLLSVIFTLHHSTSNRKNQLISKFLIKILLSKVALTLWFCATNFG